MRVSPVALVVDTYIQGHQRILDFLQKMSDEQLRWRLNAQTHSIAFHAWHVGRWTDFTQAAFPGMTPELGRRLGPGIQIWDADGLADRWGFDTAQLGYAATGMSMTDEAAMRLSFPAKEELLSYVGKVFAAADRAVKRIDAEQFRSAEQLQPLTVGIWGEGTVGDAVMEHITHDNRHLGMMECLLGLQGVSGTATE